MNFLPVELTAPLTLQHQQFRLILPEFWATHLEASGEKSFYLGVRPQHFYLDVPTEANLAVTVDLVEALGSETYISAHLTEDDSINLVVSLPPDKPITVGDSVWLAIELNKIHLFTVNDGRSLKCKSN